MSGRGDAPARPRYSRSRSRSPRYTRGYSRSRSASPKTGSRSYRRSASRSPMSNRRRHVGNREEPSVSKCIGVFGLSLYTTERELEKEFSKFGPLEKVTVIQDGKTGRSRGFGFVYYEHTEDAKAAKDAMNDQEIDGRRIRVDFSITKRPHTPTPGIYMGRPTYTDGRGGGGSSSGGYRGGGSDRGNGGGDSYGGGGYGGASRYGGGGGYRGRSPPRRSPSPYYRGSGGGRYRRDYRSRSRSYSPRRY